MPKPIRLDDFLSACAASFEFDVAYEFDPQTGHPIEIGYALNWEKLPQGLSLALRLENGEKWYLLASDWQVTRIGFRKSKGRAIIDIERRP
jgi:hypothetical protein